MCSITGGEERASILPQSPPSLKPALGHKFLPPYDQIVVGTEILNCSYYYSGTTDSTGCGSSIGSEFACHASGPSSIPTSAHSFVETWS